SLLRPTRPLLRCLSPLFYRIDEFGDHGVHAVGRLDEFDPGSIRDELLIDVADTAVRDAALEDDRSGPERQTKFVQRIELKWAGSFDLGAAAAALLDRHRLEHHTR